MREQPSDADEERRGEGSAYVWVRISTCDSITFRVLTRVMHSIPQAIAILSYALSFLLQAGIGTDIFTSQADLDAPLSIPHRPDGKHAILFRHIDDIRGFSNPAQEL